MLRGKGRSAHDLSQPQITHSPKALNPAEPAPPVPASYADGTVHGRSPPWRGRVPRTHRSATIATTDNGTAGPPTAATPSRPRSAHTRTARRAHTGPE